MKQLLINHPEFPLEKKRQILADWQNFLRTGCREEALTQRLFDHLIEAHFFITWDNHDKAAFWRNYFGRVTGQLIQFFTTFSQPSSDWAEDRPDADLNWLICQAIEPVYEQLIHTLRLYEASKAAEMVGQQLEADAFVRQDDFPDKTLPDIVAELAEATSYSWVHRGFTRITIDDDLYLSLAQFFRKEPATVKRTQVHHPALFLLRYRPETYTDASDRREVLSRNNRTVRHIKGRQSSQERGTTNENS